MLIEDNATYIETEIDNNFCATVDGKLTIEIERHEESYKIMIWRVPVDSNEDLIHIEVVPDFVLTKPEEAKEAAASKKTDPLYDPPKMPFDYTMDEAFEIMRYMQRYDRYGEILGVIENKGWYRALTDENKRKAVNYLASCMIEHYTQTEDSEYYYDEQLKEDIFFLFEDLKL